MIILKNLVKTEYPRALLLPHLIKSTGSKWHFIIHPALGKPLFGHPVSFYTSLQWSNAHTCLVNWWKKILCPLHIVSCYNNNNIVFYPKQVGIG
jgi:hypothetical protein